MSRRLLVAVVALTGLAFSILGCGGESSPEAVVGQETPAVSAPGDREALLTFFTGDVFYYDNDEWLFAEIGQTFTDDDRLRVELGYADLQFGDKALVRLQDGTEVTLRHVELTPTASDVEVQLDAGAVLTRVERLVSDDSFSVRTETSVAGVRGTEFLVEQEGDETVVAVREGSVAVLPASVDVRAVRRAAVAQDPQVAERIREVEAAAITVGENEEVAVTPEFAAEAAEGFQELQRVIEEAEATGSVDQEALETATTAARQGIEVSRQRVTPPRPVAPERQQQLQRVEEMEFVSTAPTTSTGSGGTTPAGPELVSVTFTATPDDATIFFNGRVVGTGSFSRLIEEGSAFEVAIRREGFEEEVIAVDSAVGQSYQIALQAVPQAAPEAEEQEEAPEASAAPPEPAPAAEEQEPSRTVVSVTANPSDATIEVTGQRASRGRFQGELEPGRSVTVSVSRPGFAPESREIRVTEEPVSLTIELEPRPIVATASVSSQPLVRAVAVDGSRFVATDRNGRVAAVSSDGRLLWQVDTGNSGNENGAPVAAGGLVFSSGAVELVIIRGSNGQVVHRRSLSSVESHLFGRQVATIGNTVYFPTDPEVLALSAQNGSELRRLAVPGDSKMSPAVWSGNLVLANQGGELLVIAPDSGEVLLQAATGITQPIALRPLITDQRALVVGRRGNAAMVSLTNGQVVWEATLGGAAANGVFTTPVSDGRRAYIYAGNSIFALDLASGQAAFGPLTGAAAPPAVVGSRLYYPDSAGNLVVADAASGGTRATLALPAPGTTRPGQAGELIALGTASGQIVIIHPEGIR